jgi:hypothetical protein
MAAESKEHRSMSRTLRTSQGGSLLSPTHGQLTGATYGASGSYVHCAGTPTCVAIYIVLCLCYIALFRVLHPVLPPLLLVIYLGMAAWPAGHFPSPSTALVRRPWRRMARMGLCGWVRM